jgi:lipopolysaccharide biosynthesis glycosyltransferase
MSSINICYLITDNFHSLTLESISYIRRFYKGVPDLKFYIVHVDDITEKVEGIIYIKSPYDLPIDHQRIYLPQLLDVDKFIFLDSDTVTMTCINKLWCIDMESTPIIACPSYHIRTLGDMYSIYGIPPVDNVPSDMLYFNIGMMVIDCIEWERLNLSGLVKKALEGYSNNKKCAKIAEPAFNIALHDKWQEVEESWNYCPRDKYKKPNILHYYGQNFGEKPRHIAFI